MPEDEAQASIRNSLLRDPLVVGLIIAIVTLLFAVSGTLISVWSQTGMNKENIIHFQDDAEKSGKDRWTKSDAQDYALQERSADDKRDAMISNLADRVATMEGRHDGHDP